MAVVVCVCVCVWEGGLVVVLIVHHCIVGAKSSARHWLLVVGGGVRHLATVKYQTLWDNVSYGVTVTPGYGELLTHFPLRGRQFTMFKLFFLGS